MSKDTSVNPSFINADVLERINELEKKIDKIEKKVESIDSRLSKILLQLMNEEKSYKDFTKPDIPSGWIKKYKDDPYTHT